jgi:hypothetical protein
MRTSKDELRKDLVWAYTEYCRTMDHLEDLSLRGVIAGDDYQSAERSARNANLFLSQLVMMYITKIHHKPVTESRVENLLRHLALIS